MSFLQDLHKRAPTKHHTKRSPHLTTRPKPHGTTTGSNMPQGQRAHLSACLLSLARASTAARSPSSSSAMPVQLRAPRRRRWGTHFFCLRYSLRGETADRACWRARLLQGRLLQDSCLFAKLIVISVIAGRSSAVTPWTTIYMRILVRAAVYSCKYAHCVRPFFLPEKKGVSIHVHVC
jgi:hypothetical protein